MPSPQCPLCLGAANRILWGVTVRFQGSLRTRFPEVKLIPASREMQTVLDISANRRTIHSRDDPDWDRVRFLESVDAVNFGGYYDAIDAGFDAVSSMTT